MSEPFAAEPVPDVGNQLDDLAAAFIVPRPDWTRLAACRGVDPSLFFPERGEPLGPAQAVCAGCAVRLECLRYALEPDPFEKHGVWGGTSERDRRAMRKRRHRETAA